MLVYRIAKCQYIADLSGEGAAKNGGRWNSKGVHVLYTASSVSLALLETIVHVPNFIHVDFCAATIEVPVQKIITIAEHELPDGWQTNPPLDHLKKIGDNFIKSSSALVLRIPSVVIPEEFNYLINPYHPDFSAIKIIAQKKMNIDQRLNRST